MLPAVGLPIRPRPGPGVITFTPAAITVDLEIPRTPRVAGALALLLDEINHTPPVIPGDTRPITYRITAKPGI